MTARFFRSDAMEERLGPVEEFIYDNGTDSFQLTYEHLRDWNGEIVATLDLTLGVWRCQSNGAVYSDVVIYTDDR